MYPPNNYCLIKKKIWNHNSFWLIQYIDTQFLLIFFYFFKVQCIPEEILYHMCMAFKYCVGTLKSRSSIVWTNR